MKPMEADMKPMDIIMNTCKVELNFRTFVILVVTCWSQF